MTCCVLRTGLLPCLEDIVRSKFYLRPFFGKYRLIIFRKGDLSLREAALSLPWLHMAPALAFNENCSPSTADQAPRTVLSELNRRCLQIDAAKPDMLGFACPLPTIDLDPTLCQSDDTSHQTLLEVCKTVAESLSTTGCVVIKDPRVASEDNSQFVDMMERYFSQEAQVKFQDARPELHYQVSFCPTHE